MATKSSTLKLVIAGDNKGALKAVGGLEKGLGGLQGRLGGISAAVGGAFSVGAVTAFAKKSVDAYSSFAGSVAKTSRLTGLSAKNASLLSFATQQAGVDADKANAAWVILSKNISNGKVAAEGVATKDAQGNLLSFDQILANVSDHYLGLKDATERTAFATRVMGRGAADVGKILGVGADGIEAYRDEMIGLGLQLDEKGKKQFDDFIHTQRRMQAAIQGVEVQIGSKLAPAITRVTKFFLDMDPATRNTIAAIGGLGAVVTAASLTVGLLGNSLKTGFQTLNPFSTAASRAAAASGEVATAAEAAATAAATDAAAQQALATATAASTAAQEALAVALESGTGVTAAADTAAIAYTDQMVAQSLASEAAAASAEAMAAAEGEAATASVGLTASLGPLALALGVAYGLYKGIQQAGHGIKGSFSIKVDESALKRTDAELKGIAQATSALGASFDDIPLVVLKKMASLLDHADPAYKKITHAIREQEAAEKRATANKKKFGEITEDTTAALKDEATAFRQLTSATDAVDSATSSILDTQRGMPDLQKEHADAADEAASAVSDLAEVQREAAGNSDEYRSALENVAQAEQQVADDRASVLEAIQAVDEARVEARKHLDELRQSVIDTADAERDARTEAKRAELELRRKNDDPRATALDREEAQNAATDAEHKAQAAAQDHTQAVQENAAAQAAGVEGDKGVVDAKKAVADAEDKVRDSVKGVAKANQEAAKVITDAKAKEVEAFKRVVDATTAERKAWLDLKVSQDGASASLLNYIAILDFLKETAEAVAAVGALVGGGLTGNALNGVLGIGALPSFPGSVTGAGQPGTGGGHPLPGRGRSLASSSRGGTQIHQHFHGTTRQNTRAAASAARRELDKDARRGR